MFLLPGAPSPGHEPAPRPLLHRGDVCRADGGHGVPRPRHVHGGVLQVKLC